MDVDILLLVSKLKKKFNFRKMYRTFLFSLSKPKVVYLRPFLSSLPFSKFKKQNFMYFVQQREEIGPTSSHELATFHIYYVPLTNCNSFMVCITRMIY